MKNNHIPEKQWDVITHPCSHFNCFMSCISVLGVAYPISDINTLRLRQHGCLFTNNMAAFSQTTFLNKFSWMNEMYELYSRFQLNLFLRFTSTIFQLWFRYWLVAWLAPSHYLNQCCVVYWCIYASLGHSELIVSQLHAEISHLLAITMVRYCTEDKATQIMMKTCV